jgi:hypothetical protein
MDKPRPGSEGLTDVFPSFPRPETGGIKAVVAVGETRRADGKPPDLRFSDWPTAELVGE